MIDSVIEKTNPKPVADKDIKEDIQIMIHMIEDDFELQLAIRDIYDELKESTDKLLLNRFLDLLVDKDYHTISELK